MPHTGGYLEQPAGFLGKCHDMLAVYDAFSEASNIKGTQKLSKGSMKIVQRVEQLRKASSNGRR